MGAGLAGGPLTGNPLTSINSGTGTFTRLIVNGVDTTTSNIQLNPPATEGTTFANPAFNINIAGTGQSFLWSLGGLTSTTWEMAVGYFTGGGGPLISTRAGPLWMLLPTGPGIVPITPGVNDLGTATNSWRDLFLFGQTRQQGTDSTGTPGNATIDKPSGKSAIALGAASVTITCNLCAAASRVMITPHARDATCKELIVVPGAGSFVVSGSAAATAAVPFSWEVAAIF